jgi:hypothetical protein
MDLFDIVIIQPPFVCRISPESCHMPIADRAMMPECESESTGALSVSFKFIVEFPSVAQYKRKVFGFNRARFLNSLLRWRLAVMGQYPEHR